MHHYTANKCLEVDILYNNLVLFSLLYLVLLLTSPVSVLCGIACLISYENSSFSHDILILPPPPRLCRSCDAIGYADNPRTLLLLSWFLLCLLSYLSTYSISKQLVLLLENRPGCGTLRRLSRSVRFPPVWRPGRQSTKCCSQSSRS